MGKVHYPTGQELIDLVNSGEAVCNNCGALMDRKDDPNGGCDIYVCPGCGEKVDEMDYEYIWNEEDEDDIPPGCVACGGPYPDCKSSCKLFDD